MFYQPAYLDVVCDDGEWDVALYEEGDEVVAVWPYYVKRKVGLHYITQPNLTPYLGIVGPIIDQALKMPRLRAKEIKAYHALCEQLPRIASLRVHCHPDFNNGLPLQWYGLSQTVRYTYRLNLLQKEEHLWDCMESGQRNRIRKATGSLHVQESEDPDIFINLAGKSFRRDGSQSIFSTEWFRKYDTFLGASKLRKISLAVDRQGKPLAANYTVKGKHTIYCIGIGRENDDTISGANAFLMWKTICAYRSEGYRWFDFEGGNIMRIEKFFRSFGGDLVPYYCFLKPPPLWVSAAKRIRDKFNRP